MQIRLNRMHFPVTALGFGRRIGIWVQGCSIECPGCIARDTWAKDDAAMVEIDDIVRFCRACDDDNVDGVTISGGEPFEQPEALSALIDGLIEWRNSRDIDLLCYSGKPLRHLQYEHATIIEKLDVLIPEPYVRTLPGDEIWRGSSNQALIALTPLAQSRYSPEALATYAPQFQVVTEDGRFWMIGVPQQSAIQTFEEACRERGLDIMDASWKS